MTGGRKARLLADLLNQQDEPEQPFDAGAFAIAVRDALSDGDGLPSELRRLIWISPAARAVYLRLHQAHLERVRRLWARGGFATELVRRAADGDGHAHSVTASGISLQMVQSPSTGGWLLTLQLAPEALRLLPPSTVIRVADSGGLVWFEGKVDRHGGLDAEWPDPEQSPVERLRGHTLTIDLR